jgi:FkbH-like protein
MYKKVLALDCDGTLWKGVVGEDGPLGVEPYVAFQKALVQVAKQGVLLVLVSKNNEADVWEVFDTNPAMVLKREDIIAHQICWDEKADTVKLIAEELNLGLDSFVFWDDNPIELEKMRQRTEVIVPNIPADIAMWPEYVVEEFYCDEITEEDKKRILYYRSIAAFTRDKSASIQGQSTHSEDELRFLQSINMQATFASLHEEAKMKRAVQLCQKTNQYNLRTIRHDEAAITAIMHDDANVALLMHLSDVYGDYGDIGLVLATKVSATEAFLDTFLMSCRVMQRHVEVCMLRACAAQLSQKGYTHLSGEYRPTKRNGMAASFLEKHGLDLVESHSEGVSLYRGTIATVLEKTAYVETLFSQG